MISRFSNADLVAKSFLAHSQFIPKALKARMRHHGQLLRTRVQANASGRPGPNTVTGDYRRSISLEVEDSPGTTTVTVGTNLPQGRRLEFGFNGRDSLGRTFNQPPYPHFGPAVDAVLPGLIRDLGGVADGPGGDDAGSS